MAASEHCYIHPACHRSAAGVEAKIEHTQHRPGISLAHGGLGLLQLVGMIRRCTLF